MGWEICVVRNIPGCLKCNQCILLIFSAMPSSSGVFQCWTMSKGNRYWKGKGEGKGERGRWKEKREGEEEGKGKKPFEWISTAADWPERLRSVSPWRYLKSNCPSCWAMHCRQPCTRRGCEGWSQCHLNESHFSGTAENVKSEQDYQRKSIYLFVCFPFSTSFPVLFANSRALSHVQHSSNRPESNPNHYFFVLPAEHTLLLYPRAATSQP